MIILKSTFDNIDILLISLISTTLLVIVIIILWLILCKIEKLQIKKHGSSKLSMDKPKEIKKTINKTPTTKKKKTTSKRKKGYVSPKKRKKKGSKK